jgi:hypothetical protein
VQAAEAEQDRIRPDEGQVRHAQTADHQQTDHREQHPHRAVVTVQRCTGERLRDPPSETAQGQEATEQLETAVSRDALVRERDRKIRLDASSNRPCT